MAPQRGGCVFKSCETTYNWHNWIRLYLCSGEFSVLLDQQRQTQFCRHCSSHRRTTICPLSLQTAKNNIMHLLWIPEMVQLVLGLWLNYFCTDCLGVCDLAPTRQFKTNCSWLCERGALPRLTNRSKTLLRTFSMKSLTIAFGIPTHACWIPIQWLGICPQAYHLIQVLDCFESSTHTIHLLSTQSLPFHLTVSYLAANDLAGDI